MMARLSAAVARQQACSMRFPSCRPANSPLLRLLSSTRPPPIPTWAPAKPGLVHRAAAEAAAAAEAEAEAPPSAEEERATSGRTSSSSSAARRASLPPGAFARLPVVPLPAEHLAGATRRAFRGAKPAKAAGDAAGGGTAKRAAAQQAPSAAAASRLDALAQAVCTPLGALARSFPSPASLHPFEAALLDLTLASSAGGSAEEGSGAARYEKTLARLDAGRRAVLEAGKAAAAAAAKCKNKAAAVEAEATGRDALAAAYAAKAAPPLDSLREVAKALRRLPTVDAASPTLALVGAPNVGKSSLVKALSSGLPTIAAYPFTTRSVGVGHFYVGGARHQLTDTPGLLARPAAERNAMERLTLACLAHLPTAVIFVADPSGRCGSTPAQQWAVRQELVGAFGGRGRPWVDVLSKADLVAGDLAAADGRAAAGGPPPSTVETAADLAAALPGAVRVCTLTGSGVEELQAAIVGALEGGRAAGWCG
jgi:nucleolar GTP-binding protein